MSNICGLVKNTSKISKLSGVDLIEKYMNLHLNNKKDYTKILLNAVSFETYFGSKEKLS